MEKDTKELLIRYSVSTVITFLAGFFGAIATMMSVLEAGDVSFTYAFWSGMLLAGLRAGIKATVEGLPIAIMAIQEWVNNRK